MPFSLVPSRTRFFSRLLAVALTASAALALTTLLVLALGARVPAAQAAPLTVEYVCPAYPSQLTPWTSTCTIPQFDAALGTLAGVQFTTTVPITGSAFGENISPSPAAFSGSVTGTVRIQDPAAPASTLGSGSSLFTYSTSLAAFDGVVDNGGTSGVTYNYAVTQTSAFTVTAGLGTYIGSGNVAFPISGTSAFECVFVPAGSSGCGSAIYSGALVTITYLYNTPDLSVTKSHTGNFVVGVNGTYVVNVQNVGAGPTIGPITATDTLPTGLTYITATAPGWSVPPGGAGPVLTFTRASALNAGASSLITVTVGVTNTAIGVVTNTVSVTTTRDLNPANDLADDPTTVLPSSNLRVTKSDSPDPVNALASLRYTLTPRNYGPSIAPSVTVTDALPAGTTFVAASGSGWTITQSGSVVTATRTNMAIGVAPTILITVTAPANGGTIANTARITTTTAVDGNLSNNAATANTTVTPLSDLSIAKSDAPDPVYAGNTLTYTLSVNNAGPSLAPSVTVTDALPAGVTYNGATGAGWTLTQAGGVVTATRTNLAVGAAPDIVITVTAPNAGPLDNLARVSTTATDANSSNNTASATTAVNPVADLSIAKSDAPDPVVSGTPLTYTLDVTNAGPNTAAGVTVTDTLPGGVTFGSVSAPGWDACGESGGVVTCSLASLAVGAAPPIAIAVTAPGAGGIIVNTAEVASGVADLDASDNADTAATTVATALADLAIAKTDSPDPVDAGATLTYTLSVTNNGPDAATAITVTDDLPGGAAFAGVTAPGWSCAEASGTVTCTRPSLDPAAVSDILLTADAPMAGGLITNNASVASATLDPVPGNDAASASTTVVGYADLSMSKSDGPDPVYADATLVYTLSVSNAGPSPASGVVVTDSLPAGAAYVGGAGAGWTVTQSSGVVTATRPNLAVGAAPDIVITLTAPANGGTIVNTAGVTSAEVDGDASDNTASASTEVTPHANLAVTQSDAPDPVNAGAALTYTVRVTNTGPSPAPNVVVADTLPAGAAFLGVSAPGWDSCGESGGVVTCTLPSLSVGAAPLITVAVTAPASGSLVNSVTVASGVADLTPANNTAAASTNVTPAADLAVVKTGTPDPVMVSGGLTYTLSAANNGPSTASSVTVTDTLPAGVAFGGVSAPGWDSCGESGGVVTCTLSNLSVGAAPPITITVTAPAAPGVITNTAVIGSATLDPASANNTSAIGTSVTPFVDLVIGKSNGQTSAVPGQSVTYTIIVTNTGSVAVTGAKVNDTFPSALSGVTWTCAASGGSACPASGSGTISATVNLAAGGGTVTFTATGTIAADAAGVLSNTATVTPPADITDPDMGNNTATDADALTPLVDLAISKTDGQASAAAGATVTYTIVVFHIGGPSAALGATVTDTFPAELSGVTWTCAASGGSACPASGSGDINATVDLAVGGTLTFTASGALTNTATGALTNMAFVAPPPGGSDTDNGNNSAADADSIIPATDLSISKTDGQSSAVPGTAITYTLVVANGGPNPAAGATVTDNFPAAISGVSWSCSATPGSNCGSASGAGDINAAVDLAVGGSATFTASGLVASSATGALTNTASVSTPGGLSDYDPSNNAASDADALAPQADLRVTQTDTPDPVAVGSFLRYRVVVTNTGPSNATGVTLTDVLPGSVAFASATGSCAELSSTVTCDLGSIAKGASRTTDIYVVPGAHGYIGNTASVTGSEPDPDGANNTSTAITSITLNADLSISKSDGVTTAQAGSTITYTIVATNNGAGLVTGAVVSDTLPMGLSSMAWSCAASAGSLCAVPYGSGSFGIIVDLAPGGNVTFTVIAVISTGATGNLTNTATVAPPAGVLDSNTANNTASDTDTIVGIPATGLPPPLYLPLIMNGAP
jgi:uncharacterized repeat protein (TIGR01451 family)